MRTKTPWVSNPPELTTEEDMVKWLDLVDVQKYTLRNTTMEEGLPGLIVDVAGSLNISHLDLERIPVRFGIVEGKFDCGCNNLKSLHNGPHTVKKSYNCFDNQIASLEGMPEKIWEGFNAYDNRLTSLEGGPKIVEGDFCVDQNYLKDLRGAPERVGGNFYAGWNQLNSWTGAPPAVVGSLEVQQNPLTDFIGAPKFVGGNFDIQGTKITSLTTFKTELAPSSSLIIHSTHIEELASYYSQTDNNKDSAVKISAIELNAIVKALQEKEMLTLQVIQVNSLTEPHKHKI